MIACLFLGDSTALGAAVAYHAIVGRSCLVSASEGRSPSDIARAPLPKGQIGTAMIGSGSNNPASPALASILLTTRQRITANKVIWILPYDRRAAYEVRRIAISFGDYAIDLAELPTRDGLHPTTYGGIAIALQRWRIR